MKKIIPLLALSLLPAQSILADGLDSVDPLIGTEEIPGLRSNYGGMQPMVGEPFGSMHLVPMTRSNGVRTVCFCCNDKLLKGFALSRQPAIWMGEWGEVIVRLPKPLPVESVEAHPHYAKVKAGGRTYELVASSHAAMIRSDDPTLGDGLAETGWTSYRTFRTGANPTPNFRCDWVKARRGNVLSVSVSLLGPAQAAAYVKGFRGFDVRTAWEAVLKNATVPQEDDLTYRWPAVMENRAGAPYRPSTLKIVAKGFAPDRWKVRRVTLNGRELADRRVAHADLVAGGELVFEMED